MSGTNRKKGFDFLETKVVFTISRFFFWILVGAAGLGFVVSFLILLFSLFPTIKKPIAKPKLPPATTVTLTEIKTVIVPPIKYEKKKPKEVKKHSEKVKPEKKPKPDKPTPDPLQVALYAKIDTLKSYFPADEYTWTTISERVVVARDYWGNPSRWETRIKVYGLDRQLNKVLKLYDEKEAKINVVKELLSIIPQIGVKNRDKALEAYASMRIKKEWERKNQIEEIGNEIEIKRARANAKYLAARVKKTQKRMWSLKTLGVTFVSIAILGIFLVFLAIERNTRALQKLIEKRG